MVLPPSGGTMNIRRFPTNGPYAGCNAGLVPSVGVTYTAGAWVFPVATRFTIEMWDVDGKRQVDQD